MKKLLLTFTLLLTTALAAPPQNISFHRDFEGGSMGQVDKVSETQYRVHVAGQANETGRNRQPTWYYFRIDGARGRELTITLTGFIGEYNFKPAVAMSAVLRPMFSADGVQWQHFTETEWDDEKKEMTFRCTPTSDAFFIAHIQPYTHTRLLSLLRELEPRESVRVEVIGRTPGGRDLHELTVTDWQAPDAQKKCVWLQARQHAWEAGTSYAMEGALRFITSDEPAARELRRKTIFKFTPMCDPDGVVAGNVRFNTAGFDVNRHWTEVDLRDPKFLRQMPEIWYTKKAILAGHAKQRISLLVNMHNTETAEYLDTAVDDDVAIQPFTKLFAELRDHSLFDPSRLPVTGAAHAGLGTASDLWLGEKVPVALMELRIGPSKKLGRYPTADDRLAFGRELIQALAEAAQ